MPGLPRQAAFEKDLEVSPVRVLIQARQTRQFFAKLFEQVLMGRFFGGAGQGIGIVPVSDDFIKHDPQRPDVAAFIDGAGHTSPGLFRRHVPQRADDVARTGDGVTRPTAPVRRLHGADAEIQNVRLPVRVNQDVAGFQVAMDDSGGMSVSHRQAHAPEDGELFLQVVGHGSQVFVEVNALNVIHDEIHGVPGHSGVEASDHPWRMDFLENGDFTLEPAALHLTRAAQNLQRDQAGFSFEPPGFVDHAETPATDLAHDMAVGDVGHRRAPGQLEIARQTRSTFAQVLVEPAGLFRPSVVGVSRRFAPCVPLELQTVRAIGMHRRRSVMNGTRSRGVTPCSWFVGRHGS